MNSTICIFANNSLNYINSYREKLKMKDCKRFQAKASRKQAAILILSEKRKFKKKLEYNREEQFRVLL